MKLKNLKTNTMEFTLDINMNTEDFASFKDELLKTARENNACEEGIEAHLNSTTPQEWLDKCGCYLGWLAVWEIDVKIEGFTYSDGCLNLEDYEFPLPNSFTYCNGYLDVEGYKHPLPNTFTHCNGCLDLYGYKYALPEGFTHCGGDLFVGDYKHPLPKGFKAKGKY